MRELEGGRREVYDVDWEKVKTLPRVCLIPPEGKFTFSRGLISFTCLSFFSGLFHLSP